MHLNIIIILLILICIISYFYFKYILNKHSQSLNENMIQMPIYYEEEYIFYDGKFEPQEFQFSGILLGGADAGHMRKIYYREFNSYKPKLLDKAKKTTIRFPYSTLKINDKRNGYDLDHSVVIYDDKKMRFHNMIVDKIEENYLYKTTYIIGFIEFSNRAREIAERMQFPGKRIAICSTKPEPLKCKNNMKDITDCIKNNDNYFVVLLGDDLETGYTVQHILPKDIKPMKEETIEEIEKCLSIIPKDENVYYYDSSQRKIIMLKNDGTVDVEKVYEALLSMRESHNYYPSTTGIMVGLVNGLPE